MSENINLRRTAKGKKPQYFEDPVTDNLLSMVLVLSQELSVALDRIDTLEQILSEGGHVSLEHLQNYKPSDVVQERREEERQLMLRRLFRASEAEHHNRSNGPVEDIEKVTL